MGRCEWFLYSEDSAVILFGFGMKMKDSGVLWGGKGRVCITAYICWARFRVSRGFALEFYAKYHTCDILCIGFFLCILGGSYSGVGFL